MESYKNTNKITNERVIKIEIIANETKVKEKRKVRVANPGKQAERPSRRR